MTGLTTCRMLQTVCVTFIKDLQKPFHFPHPCCMHGDQLFAHNNCMPQPKLHLWTKRLNLQRNCPFLLFMTTSKIKCSSYKNKLRLSLSRTTSAYMLLNPLYNNLASDQSGAQHYSNSAPSWMAPGICRDLCKNNFVGFSDSSDSFRSDIIFSHCRTGSWPSIFGIGTSLYC